MVVQAPRAGGVLGAGRGTVVVVVVGQRVEAEVARRRVGRRRRRTGHVVVERLVGRAVALVGAVVVGRGDGRGGGGDGSVAGRVVVVLRSRGVGRERRRARPVRDGGHGQRRRRRRRRQEGAEAEEEEVGQLLLVWGEKRGIDRATTSGDGGYIKKNLGSAFYYCVHLKDGEKILRQLPADILEQPLSWFFFLST